MSAVIIVQQYFTPECVDEAPEIFRAHRRLAAGFEGFIALRLLRPLSDAEDGQVTLLLEFRDEPTLTAWRESAEHASVAEMYGRFRRKPPVAHFYRAEQ
jgi:heme-degrading monooxygenase HmoA